MVSCLFRRAFERAAADSPPSLTADVHPLPLPGSFLYGNMLMRHLADAVREREGVHFLYEEDEPIASGLFSGLAASASA